MKKVPSFCQRPGFPKGLRVLLVQNAKQLGDGEQAALQEQLAGASYEVTVAKDAPSGSLLLRGDAAFDICLVEATDFFAASEAGVVLRETADELPVVLLTRSVEPAVILKAIKAGAMDVMAVPMAPRNVDRLWQHCVRKRMAVTAERAASNVDRDRDAPRSGAGAAPGKSGAPGGARVGGQTCIPLHGSGGARGPSWSSLPPPPALAAALAAPAQHADDASPSEGGAPGGSSARVTRPRTRPSAVQQRPAMPGRWAAPAPPGVKHVSWGRQPPLAPQPLTPAGGADAPERPPSALSGLPPTVAPPPLPAWCLGPLGDVDMDDTDVLSPFDDLDDPTASAATLLPAMGTTAAGAPGSAMGTTAAGSAPGAALAGAMLPPAAGGPLADVAGTVGCYTSLQAQLAHLEHVVALEASLALAGTAAGAAGDGAASPTGSGASSAAGSATCAGGAMPPACGPLGLKLRKSASLVDLVASALSTAEGGVAWRIAA